MPKNRRIVFTILFLALGGAALLTPHLVDGHIISVSRPWAETAALAVDMFLGLLFYALYRADIRRHEQARKESEIRLRSSFGYIGRKNVESDVVRNFMNTFARGDTHEQVRKTFDRLLRIIAVTVLKTDAAMVRLFDPTTWRTRTEYSYPAPQMFRNAKVSSKEVYAAGNGPGGVTPVQVTGNGEKFALISSEYRFGDSALFMYYRVVDAPDGDDSELAQTLVNQFHLLHYLEKDEKGRS